MTWETNLGTGQINMVRIVWSHKSLKSIFNVIGGAAQEGSEKTGT